MTTRTPIDLRPLVAHLTDEERVKLCQRLLDGLNKDGMLKIGRAAADFPGIASPVDTAEVFSIGGGGTWQDPNDEHDGRTVYGLTIKLKP